LSRVESGSIVIASEAKQSILSFARRKWIASLRFARNDVWIHVRILAALTASEVASTFVPLEKRGRRESRVPNAPAASRAK
jgi:hypothetical protein